MNVTSATSAAATQSPTPTTAAPPDSLDYNAFLTLLIAQMKNQDPTKPTDPSQFVAQLASFSGVEQAIKTNSKLDTLMTSLALTQAEGFIGRTMASADGSVPGTVGIRIVSGGAVAILDNGREVPARRRRHGEHDMNQADALDIVQSALWTVIVASGPAVAAACRYRLRHLAGLPARQLAHGRREIGVRAARIPRRALQPLSRRAVLRRVGSENCTQHDVGWRVDCHGRCPQFASLSALCRGNLAGGLCCPTHQWSGFDIRYPPSRGLTRRMSNPKLH